MIPHARDVIVVGSPPDWIRPRKRRKQKAKTDVDSQRHALSSPLIFFFFQLPSLLLLHGLGRTVETADRGVVYVPVVVVGGLRREVIRV